MCDITTKAAVRKPRYIISTLIQMQEVIVAFVSKVEFI